MEGVHSFSCCILQNDNAKCNDSHDVQWGMWIKKRRMFLKRHLKACIFKDIGHGSGRKNFRNVWHDCCLYIVVKIGKRLDSIHVWNQGEKELRGGKVNE